MRKMYVSTVAVLAALLLNACTPSTGNPQVDAFLQQVQAIAKQVCGIEIVAAQIVAMIPVPALTTPVAVATSLCNQVVASRRYGRVLRATANGDVIQVNINGYVVNVTVKR